MNTFSQNRSDANKINQLSIYIAPHFACKFPSVSTGHTTTTFSQFHNSSHLFVSDNRRCASFFWRPLPPWQPLPPLKVSYHLLRSTSFKCLNCLCLNALYIGILIMNNQNSVCLNGCVHRVRDKDEPERWTFIVVLLCGNG